MTAEVQKPVNGHKTELWTRIATAVGGGLILALQGVNLSETSGQTHLITRIDVALEQQLALVKEVNAEGARIDLALTNQQKMIENMDTLLHNQNTALDLLKEHEKPQSGP